MCLKKTHHLFGTLAQWFPTFRIPTYGYWLKNWNCWGSHATPTHLHTRMHTHTNTIKFSPWGAYGKIIEGMAAGSQFSAHLTAHLAVNYWWSIQFLLWWSVTCTAPWNQIWTNRYGIAWIAHTAKTKLQCVLWFHEVHGRTSLDCVLLHGLPEKVETRVQIAETSVPDMGGPFSALFEGPKGTTDLVKCWNW